MELQLTKADVIHYSRLHQRAMLLHKIATDDYVAARCCLFNGLLPQGYILAEQAMEKELKSLLLLISPKEDFRNRKIYRQHNLNDLLNRLHELSTIDLNSFVDLGTTLTEAYELSRYPDNKLAKTITSWSMSSSIIDDVDEMYFYLLERSIMPVEVKFRSSVYVLAFEESFINQKTKEWALYKNVAFGVRSHDLQMTYQNVLNHLYSK